MRIYYGLVTPDGTHVVAVCNQRAWSLLDPRHDLWCHSPDGFCWGYCGSGPAQLALALVADATEDDALAIETYQDFKTRVVSRWPMERRWKYDSERVSKEACQIISERKLRPAAYRLPPTHQGGSDCVIF